MENVNDDIHVIDHEPLALGIALGAAGAFPDRFLGMFPDIAGDRLEVGGGGSGANDKEIRDRGNALKIEHYDVFGLNFVGVFGTGFRNSEGVWHNR